MKKGAKKKRVVKNSHKKSNLKTSIVAFIFLAIALIIIFNLTGFKLPLQSPSTTGLMIYYPFQENTNDASGNNNHGTSTDTSGVVTGRPGLGKTASFTAPGKTGQIVVGNSAGLNYPQLTFSSWIYVDDASPSFSRIAGKYDFFSTSNQNGWVLQTEETEKNKIKCMVSQGSTKISAISPDQSVLDEGWTHVACTFDANKNLKLYINGEEVASTTGTIAIPTTTYPIKLGSTGATIDDKETGFVGKIDEVYIYNRALSNADIKELYKEGFKFTGLPTDFQPIMGYQEHTHNSKKVYLSDSNGNLYTSTNGIDFTDVTSTKSSIGLSQNFIPTVGFTRFYKTTNSTMFNFPGQFYEKPTAPLSSSSSSFTEISRSVYASSIPSPENLRANFNPIVGYYHGFGKGRVALINAEASYAIWSAANNRWVERDKDYMLTNNNLPTETPKVGYYYWLSNCPNVGPIGDLDRNGIIEQVDVGYATNPSGYNSFYDICGDINGDGFRNSADGTIINNILNGQSAGPVYKAGVHLWFLINNQPKLYSWPDQSGKFADITSQLTGLPTNKVPDAGYFDNLHNKVFLWYGKDVYVSSGINTINFVKLDLTMGTTDEVDGSVDVTPTTCTTGTQATVCEDDEVCLDNVCVPGDLCIDEDAEPQNGNELQIAIFPNERSSVKYADGTVAGTDSCIRRTEEVKEWYCDENGEPATVNVLCLGECSNGACEDEFEEIDCEEEDDKKEYDVQSKATLYFDGEEILEVEDACLSSRKLLEFFCEDNSIKSIERNCRTREKCENGACVPETQSTTGGSPTGASATSGSSGITSCTTDGCEGDKFVACVNGQKLPPIRINGQCGYIIGTQPPTNIECTTDNNCDADEFCNGFGYCQLGSEEPNTTGLWIAIILIIIFIIGVIGVIIFITIKRQNQKHNRPNPINHHQGSHLSSGHEHRRPGA